MSDLERIASDAVKLAQERGATDAECTISDGAEFEVNVRMGEVESVKEAGSRGAGIRVLAGQKSGSSYTSDFSAEGIAKMVGAAIELAKLTSEDPHAGLPEDAAFGKFGGDLKLFDPAIAALGTDWKIAQAMEAEKAAFATDPRIANSKGAGFSSNVGSRTFANSRGFSGTYQTSSCGLAVQPVAVENGSTERDYWYTSSRTATGLETAEYVGRTAAERALRRLNSRKIATQKAAIVFEPRTAQALLGDLFDAVSGSEVYRQASFLAGKLGVKIGSDAVTIIDDATMPGLFGSSPFDDEGVASRRTVVIERGVLNSYLLNTYTAKKLGLKSTGNASRGLSGAAGVGPGNFYLAAGETPREKLIAGVRSGLYVTELIGTAANIVTGDYSSGAAGLWIENGEFAYPVSEITIAGNLKQMLMDVELTGSDLEFRGSIAAPTILIREMTISGH